MKGGSVEKYRREIQLLQSEIEKLVGMPEEDARRALLGSPLIDSQRLQTVLHFREQGFTVTCSEAGITDRLEAVEEMREFWLAKLDDPDPHLNQRAARSAECVYIAAQCKTELATRGYKRWSEIGRLLCEEEIARLQWEILKSGYEPDQ
jgi:hypothetical protein